MAVATLLLWLCTAAVGAYLLVTSVHSATASPGQTSAQGQGQAQKRPVRAKDRFDPPSLQRAKSEPMPGLRELAEFAHPALALIGMGVWFGYVVSRDRVFAVIGLGILLGAICAGLSWFTANARAARRAAASAESGASRPSATRPGAARPSAGPLSPSPRLLILHAAGAALTLLFAVLIAVRG